LLDDSDFDRRRIRRLSKKTDLPITLDEVSSIEELEAAVRLSRYDLVMIDYRLPVGNGMQALDRLERDPQNKHSGKIMITGAGETRTAVKAMQGGCHDFIEKEDLSVHLLRNSITHAIQAAQKQLQGQITTSHQEALVRKGFLSALDDRNIRSHVDAVIADQLQIEQQRGALAPPPRSSNDVSWVRCGGGRALHRLRMTRSHPGAIRPAPKSRHSDFELGF